METARAIKNTDQKYTYADYLTWDDGQRKPNILSSYQKISGCLYDI